MGGTYSANGQNKKVYRLLIETPEGLTTLGRPRHRWGDNTKTDLVEIGLDVVGCVCVA
jgi:hypothetical protein